MLAAFADGVGVALVDADAVEVALCDAVDVGFGEFVGCEDALGVAETLAEALTVGVGVGLELWAAADEWIGDFKARSKVDVGSAVLVFVPWGALDVVAEELIDDSVSGEADSLECSVAVTDALGVAEALPVTVLLGEGAADAAGAPRASKIARDVVPV